MKRIISIIFCLSLIFVFSACGSGTNSTSSTSTVKTTGSFLKSADGGKSWENKVNIDDKNNIGLVDVLSMSINQQNSQIIYLGTESNGLYVTKNGAENWQKLNFPLTKIYGLTTDKLNGQTVYASGVLNKRAKIFKSTDGGDNWKEIYTEPSEGTVISSLATSSKNSNILYAGTDGGMIFKSIDGGQSWRNLFKADAPVINISFDCAKEEAVYFGVFQRSILRTLDGGNKIDDLGKITINKIVGKEIQNRDTYSLTADPKNSGVLYVGTADGLLKGSDFGDKWEEINILESSKKFAIRAIGINPLNPSEIVYSNSGAIYHSINGGTDWLTFQLNTKKIVEILLYDPLSAGIVYAGLREL